MATPPVNEGQRAPLFDTIAGSRLTSDDYRSVGTAAVPTVLDEFRHASLLASGKTGHAHAAAGSRRAPSADPLQRRSSLLLSALPEVAKSIELRYKLLFLGSAAAKLCKQLAKHSCVSQESDSAEMSLLCEVPRISTELKAESDGDSESDEDDDQRRRASVLVQRATAFSDNVPNFTSTADAFNAAALFVVHIAAVHADAVMSKEPKELDASNSGQDQEDTLADQMWLLNAMALQYYHQDSSRLASFNGLLVLKDPGTETQALPADVDEFRDKHSLNLVVVPYGTSTANLLQTLESIVSLIPEHAEKKERAMLGTPMMGTRMLGTPKRRSSAPTQGASLPLPLKLRGMLQSAGQRISQISNPVPSRRGSHLSPERRQ